MVLEGERWGTLTGPNVSDAQRWCSAWADLLLIDMALLERRELEARFQNMFRRRVLWESAVVSYGRLAVSNRKRKIHFKDFVAQITGAEGLALHEQIMEWRHGHVAHRTSPEFESIETVLTFKDAEATPSALEIVLSTDAGPLDDSEFVVAFRQHVKVLRDAMYEQKIKPLGVSIVDDFNSGRIPNRLVLRPAKGPSSWDRYGIKLSVLKLAATESP